MIEMRRLKARLPQPHISGGRRDFGANSNINRL
jgi:hypothetical protein